MKLVGETMNGRYLDMHRVLGTGTYASVRLGGIERHGRVEETCALKFPLAGCEAELQAEIGLLRNLVHPNVVAVSDVFRSSVDGHVAWRCRTPTSTCRGTS